jgi:hypothetical protein
MSEDFGAGPERGKRRGVTMRQLAASYSPRGIRDYFFLHGLARIAARRTLRTDDRLYVPREWERSDPAEEPHA